MPSLTNGLFKTQLVLSHNLIFGMIKLGLQLRVGRLQLPVGFLRRQEIQSGIIKETLQPSRLILRLLSLLLLLLQPTSSLASGLFASLVLFTKDL